MLGTLIDAYYQGYDVILVSDATATTSPDGGYENVIYNAGGVRFGFTRYLLPWHAHLLLQSYGFVTDSKRIVEAAKND